MKIRYLGWLFPLFFCCCNKPSAPVTPDPDFVFAYNAVYDSVIAMPANSTFIFIFDINVTNGDINLNRLGCSITGLPGNVTVTPASQSVGLIMGGTFTFTTGDIGLCTDTINFIISSPSTGTVTHKLILKITPPVDYAPKLAGTYDSVYDFCSPHMYDHNTVITTAPDTTYTINITNLYNLGSVFVVRAKVTDVITIPFQTVAAYRIWGSGTYTRDYRTGYKFFKMTINDTLVSGLDTTVCTANILHS